MQANQERHNTNEYQFFIKMPQRNNTSLLKKQLKPYIYIPLKLLQPVINPLYRLVNRLEVQPANYAVEAYSQEGEDLILWRIFAKKPVGFYVDVGAHHARRFSNTYIFYLRGWRGINIDATPGSMVSFRQDRPHDINIEAAIANEQKELTFFMFRDRALNSFDEAKSRRLVNAGHDILQEQKIQTCRLTEILQNYLPDGQEIDFLSIDVEELDLEVLKSNDWQRYRPVYILFEDKSFDATNPQVNETHRFMVSQNYEFFAKTVSTLIYRSQTGQ